MLDLSNPAHREALGWACAQVQRSTNLARELMGPVPAYSIRTEREGLWKDRETAVRALSSPAESAAIVRAELERCGATATVRIVAAIEPPYLSVDDGTYDNMISSYDVPALILRLLAATTREEALAALRGVS